MKHYVSGVAGLFFVLCILFVPFVQQDWQFGVTTTLFSSVVKYMGNMLFTKPLVLLDFSSDTRGLLILLVVLLVLAVLFSLAFRKYTGRLTLSGNYILIYFLAFVMLKYGAFKIFKLQFYTPEPNILYTPFGRLDKDILYWSVMGLSPVYSVITGAVEVLAALLLLCHRTRFSGLLLTIASLIQIVLINFAFDISVKMFSVLLLAIAFYVACPQIKILLKFLLKREAVILPRAQKFPLPFYQKAALKMFVVGLMFLQVIPQLSGVKDPHPLTGAYELQNYSKNGQSADLCSINIKRVFFHSKSYIIIQNVDDSMKDFHFTMNEREHELLLEGYANDTFKIRYFKDGDTLKLDFLDGRVLTFSKLPYDQLPALQSRFHFFTDDMVIPPNGSSAHP